MPFVALSKRHSTANLFVCKTTRIGFEPTTSAVTGRRSNQLSHRAVEDIDIPSKPHTQTFHPYQLFMRLAFTCRKRSLAELRSASCPLLRKCPTGSFRVSQSKLCSSLHSPSAASYAFGQALDRLVAVSSTHCCASTSALSTSSSSRGLTAFAWDISS